MAAGQASFVDANRGDDSATGKKDAPWRTLAHALEQLKPGATLYLREGVFNENVVVSLSGSPRSPITIRSFPGEQAIIDSALAEFFTAPEDSWTPFAHGAAGEYRSARRHPNLRNVIGSFGDSMIGLQTYYHAKDLRAKNEVVDWEDWDHTDKSDIKPLYCGPGIWYDRQSGYIHCRLAHTHLPAGLVNYQGPTDPRKIPLVIAPFRSVALSVNGGEHIRFQDLVIRGGGYATVELDHARHIEFDNVTVWCGSYGMRATRTGPLRFYRSALYGNAAPWTFRNDTSKRDYPGRPHRNITRLNTHALLEITAGGESSVYATPQNDEWEFAHSEFTDAHDGLYLGAINVRFHHNLVENFQDDGIYLSPMYYRYRLLPNDPQIEIYENVFRGVLTALAFGGPVPATSDRVFVYRNVFDLRQPINTGRPSSRRPEPGRSTGKLIGDHGSPPWSAITAYHNTIIASQGARHADMELLGHSAAERPRRVFNNIFVHLARLPGITAPDASRGVQSDGNLYWSPAASEQQAKALFNRFRSSEQFAASKQIYGPGSTSHSICADPRFRKPVEGSAAADCSIAPESPAANTGVALPKEWPDSLRASDKGRPDIGALPVGERMFSYGRGGD